MIYEVIWLHLLAILVVERRKREMKIADK